MHGSQGRGKGSCQLAHDKHRERYTHRQRERAGDSTLEVCGTSHVEGPVATPLALARESALVRPPAHPSTHAHGRQQTVVRMRSDSSRTRRAYVTSRAYTHAYARAHTCSSSARIPAMHVCCTLSRSYRHSVHANDCTLLTQIISHTHQHTTTF